MLEAFLVDVISTFFALSIARLTTRQAMWFVTLSVLKAVDDHCGYAIPWDPFQWLTPQNALYHDIHHQAWGIKVGGPRLLSLLLAPCTIVPCSVLVSCFQNLNVDLDSKETSPLGIENDLRLRRCTSLNGITQKPLNPFLRGTCLATRV